MNGMDIKRGVDIKFGIVFHGTTTYLWLCGCVRPSWKSNLWVNLKRRRHKKVNTGSLTDVTIRHQQG